MNEENPQINTNPKEDTINITKKTNQLNLNDTTPCINLISSQNKNEYGIIEKSKDNSNQNFKTLFNQIVNSENDILNGDVDIVEYLIIKYSDKEIKKENIKSLTKLYIKIDSELDILDHFGQSLPNLIELTLNGSLIRRIYDIGCNFSNLKTLNISNCFLEDLNGILLTLT